MAIVAIVGRPNVGKSTLFNRISRKRHALVADIPGVTRDRLYAEVSWQEKSFTLVDTGGFVSKIEGKLEEQTRQQVLLAIEEADIIVFLADGKVGLHPEDRHLVDLLRRSQKPVLYAVNKIDGPEQEIQVAEFYELGLERLYALSAAHGYGVSELLDAIVERLPRVTEDESGNGDEIRVAIVGRPNVGKSTLLNRILGTNRVIVSDVPGTTRDAIDTPFVKDGKKYLLIDTAGIRKKRKTSFMLDKVSVIKSLQSIERSHVVLLLVDALESPTDQDLHIGGYIQDRFRGCVIIVNKWDAFDQDPKVRQRFLRYLKERFRFLPFAPIIAVSALTGKRVNRILPCVREVFDQYSSRFGTGVVNRVLQKAIERHQPPMVSGRRLKFYYATQVQSRPPTFVLFCNSPELVRTPYERYLANYFRNAFSLDKTPVRLVFRER